MKGGICHEPPPPDRSINGRGACRGHAVCDAGLLGGYRVFDDGRVKMYRAKKKTIGGREYVVIGSTITREGFQIVEKSYTTSAGKVVVKNGKVTHPDGAVTSE